MSLYEENTDKIDVEDKAPVEDPTGGKPQGDQGPNEVDQLLTGIKNESGEPKYANVQEALKGAAHAQEFINQLKQEQADLRAKLKSQEEIQQMLNPTKEQEQDKTEVKNQSQDVQSLTPEQVLEIVEQREAQKVADGNLNKVKEALQSQFGAEFKKTLSSKTEELGLTPELVDNMAKTSPQALLKLFGVEGAAKQKTSLRSSASSEAMGSQPRSEEPKRFDPFKKDGDKHVKKWLEVQERTKARLGLNQ